MSEFWWREKKTNNNKQQTNKQTNQQTKQTNAPWTGSCGTSNTRTDIAAARSDGDDIPNAMVV